MVLYPFTCVLIPGTLHADLPVGSNLPMKWIGNNRNGAGDQVKIKKYDTQFGGVQRGVSVDGQQHQAVSSFEDATRYPGMRPFVSETADASGGMVFVVWFAQGMLLRRSPDSPVVPCTLSQFFVACRLDAGTGNLTTVVDLNTVPDATGRIIPALQVLAGMPQRRARTERAAPEL